MNQLAMQFDSPRRVETKAFARTGDPATSVAAAESVKATNLEQRVLDVLRSFGRAGGTSFEVAERLQLNVVNVSPRFKPLVKKGLVYDSGETRCGASGRSRIVWRAVEANDVRMAA